MSKVPARASSRFALPGSALFDSTAGAFRGRHAKIDDAPMLSVIFQDEDSTLAVRSRSAF